MTESSCYRWSCDRNPVHLLTYSIDLYLLQEADEDHGRESNGGYFCSQVAHFVWNIDQQTQDGELNGKAKEQ